MQLARLTLELHRPVPVAAVDVALSVLREGRRLQLVDIRLSAGGGEVARASVLRLRTEALAVPAGVPQPAFDRPPPEAGEPSAMPAGAGFGSLFQLSSVGGAFRVPGLRPSGSDCRARSAEGRPPSGAALAAAVSDFSNGISSVLPFEQWSFINPDLSVNLARAPVGDWILSDAETILGPDGRAVARTRLADRQGWLGHATQSVLLDRRAPQAAT
jgi:hypothetical protein